MRSNENNIEKTFKVQEMPHNDNKEEEFKKKIQHVYDGFKYNKSDYTKYRS